MISVVTVLHNSESSFLDYNHSLAVGYAEEAIEVILVDNASDRPVVPSQFSIPVTIVKQANRGFGAGCNVGWHHARGNWVAFVNPDVKVSSTELIKLASKADSDLRVALVAPFISNSDSFSEAMGPSWRVKKYLVNTPLTPDLPSLRTAASVSGSCMLIRRQFLEEVGGFDERFFMYCEENDIQKRLLDSGYVVAVDTSIVVRHNSGTGSVNPRLNRGMERAKSKKLFYRKHYSRAGWVLMSTMQFVRKTAVVMRGVIR